MAGAVDPTYPLYPVASILSAVMLLLVLLTSFVRHSWNLGVAFLCFWLFWGNLTYGINGILWSDNGDVKAFAYCDIGKLRPMHARILISTSPATRLHIIVNVVKPMATLIITRRLYLITSLRSVEPPTKAAVSYSARPESPHSDFSIRDAETLR